TLIERQVLDRVCGPELNAARRALGLAPARRILGRWLHSTDGVLCLFPSWFAPAQPDWPANHLQSGFALFNDVGPVSADAELDEYTTASDVRRLAAYVRRAEFATIRQAGHFLDLEGRQQQEQVRAAVLGFFADERASAARDAAQDETLAPLGQLPALS
ncbi:alpha/beta fold hydrolase, partial [Burkholderia pseudomallei]|uniref:alpha/beta fold hydrolase n=1 Tax=Burkholderia pseudomallei TaxID=28450 RepID=UPI00358E7CBA